MPKYYVLHECIDKTTNKRLFPKTVFDRKDDCAELIKAGAVKVYEKNVDELATEEELERDEEQQREYDEAEAKRKADEDAALAATNAGKNKSK